MFGLMMERPLLISSLLAYAAANHRDGEIVSRTVEGPIHRYTYADAHRRVGKLANALVRLGVRPGDRIATLAWNGYRHFELYYGISGIGAVCHTVNPRLFEEQIVYIVNHAADRLLFVDLTFLPLIEKLAPRMPTLERVVVMTDRDHLPSTSLPDIACYEDMLEPESHGFEWPDFDERTASGLCYTSGTTGSPKGVLYSHRSSILHALSKTIHLDGRWTSRAVWLVNVPMFHVNAWGSPYCGALAGGTLVFPGPKYDAPSLCELLESERVTLSSGVPTIWLGLLDHLKQTGKRLPHLKSILSGGAAPALSMIRAIEDLGIEFVHGWGLTETSPVGALNNLSRALAMRPREEQFAAKLRQGRPPYGFELRLVGANGEAMPHDGTATGEVMARGNWVASAYHAAGAAGAPAFSDDGWFRTGDIGTIDTDGNLQITDRAKDLIKSGGEWISSIDLEGAAMGHPDVAMAAAIAQPHPKWGERPLLVVVPKTGKSPTAAAIRDYLVDKVAKWWLPDDVVFIDALPLTATGKVSKLLLRERFREHKLPTA